MFDFTLAGYAFPALGISVILAIILRLYPRPYPGIPYNQSSAKRISGDIPELVPLIKSNNEFSDNLFTVTTRRLGTPIAQLLFPGVKKPLIILDDPREIEDICVRRNAEFDVAPMEIEISGPMFPNSPLAMYTTPELKAQKRRWADTVSYEFLRGAVTTGINKTTLDLIELWRLKASLHKETPFTALGDLENSTLDAIWETAVGEESGITRSEISKLQRQIVGDETPVDLPCGAFIKGELVYLTDTIARNTLSVSPKWAQSFETYTPRFRKSRRVIRTEIGRAIEKVVEKYQTRDSDGLDTESYPKDTCMIDLVIRRQIQEAEKEGKILGNPALDHKFIDETFVMICAGHDSTANTLAWFVKFISLNQSVQAQLRTTLQAAFPGPDLPSAQEILDADIPYLSGTCEEAVRLSGAAKAQLRMAVVDTEVLGCKVPKGAQVFMNLHIDRQPPPIDEAKRSVSCQAAAARLGDGIKTSRDLGCFEPRRWLVTDEKTGTEAFNPHALPSVAFGGGFRGCFGRKLGEMELRIVIALLILNFEFLELPEKFRIMTSHERIFRHPDAPMVRLRALREQTRTT